MSIGNPHSYFKEKGEKGKIDGNFIKQIHDF